MKDACSKVLCRHVFRRKAGVFERKPIRVQRSAPGVQEEDELSDSVDDLPEFSFRLLDLFECHRQGRLRSLALDSDSGNATGVIEQLNFARIGMSNFAKKHAEGPQHFTVVWHDGVRPGGAESTLYSKR